MPTLLIKNARLLVTIDAQRREIAGGAVFVRGNVIETVGVSSDLPATADEVIDAHDQIVITGLVNTHHHIVQTLTRACAQDEAPAREALEIATLEVPVLLERHNRLAAPLAQAAHARR